MVNNPIMTGAATLHNNNTSPDNSPRGSPGSPESPGQNNNPVNEATTTPVTSAITQGPLFKKVCFC